MSSNSEAVTNAAESETAAGAAAAAETVAAENPIAAGADSASAPVVSASAETASATGGEEAPLANSSVASAADAGVSSSTDKAPEEVTIKLGCPKSGTVRDVLKVGFSKIRRAGAITAEELEDLAKHVAAWLESL